MDKHDPAYEEAFQDWKSGMKYKEIAEKYDVSLSAVKSWAARDWKLRKVATGKKKGCNRRGSKSRPKKGPGPPLGNQNAKGHGAPLRNTRALKHGLYAGVYWDVLSDDEKAMLEDMDFSDEEEQLENQIATLSVRERRLMKDLNKMRATGNPEVNKPGMIVDSVIRNEWKKEPEPNLGIEISAKDMKAKIKEKGRSYHLTTSVVNSSELIVKFEAELTRVQKQKAKCIEQLAKIRDDKARCAREEEEAQRKRNAAAEGKSDSNVPMVQIVLPDNGRDKK